MLFYTPRETKRPGIWLKKNSLHHQKLRTYFGIKNIGILSWSKGSGTFIIKRIWLVFMSRFNSLKIVSIKTPTKIFTFANHWLCCLAKSEQPSSKLWKNGNDIGAPQLVAYPFFKLLWRHLKENTQGWILESQKFQWWRMLLWTIGKNSETGVGSWVVWSTRPRLEDNRLGQRFSSTEERFCKTERKAGLKCAQEYRVLPQE